MAILITAMALLIDGLFLSCHKYVNVEDAFVVDIDEITNAIDIIGHAISGNQKVSSRQVYLGVLGLLLCQFFLLILYYVYAVSKTSKGRHLCCSLTSLCCICIPKSKKNPMKAVGELLSGLGPKDSFIKSDVIAGLTTLYATSKITNVDDRVQTGIENF